LGLYITNKKILDTTRERNHPFTAITSLAVGSREAQHLHLNRIKEVTVVFRGEDHKKGMEYCLMDENERGCFMLGGISCHGDHMEVYANRTFIPPDHSYKVRQRGGIRIKAEYMLGIYDEYELTDAQAVIAIHSHPFSQKTVGFSDIDMEAFHDTARHCLIRKEGAYVSLVMGQNGIFDGMFTTSPGKVKRDVSLKIMGEDGIMRIPEPKVKLDADRLNRQIPIFSEYGQKRIANTKLAIVGTGGTGSNFAMMAAYHGIEFLTLIDNDPVEESNRNRIFAGHDDIGKKKVDVARRNVEKISKSIKCKAVPLQIQEVMDELWEADVVASCVDNDEARLLLQEYCAKHYKVLVDLGAGGRVKDGQIVSLGSHARIYYPSGPCICCLGLNPARIRSESLLRNRRNAGYIDGLENDPVQILPINSIASSVGIKLLTWYLSGQRIDANFVQYNALQDSMTPLMMEKHESCPICGTDGIEGMGDNVPMDLSKLDDISLDDISEAYMNQKQALNIEEGPNKPRSKLSSIFGKAFHKFRHPQRKHKG